ncbi:DUF6501 family protein [Jeotgalibacillus proteolyticus]|uniref:Uncharacterized protein n=1 Tax=Jeotgalibacillus proteolyticus TaxID=2082395 RepID=A0A2S5GFM3_9BACL|nr:DUF6501 family protein [Jeotgalibacillus proteolyticus]PPA71832.1 hypothetical protein C4B60_00180 [Jeotgalibacillus proteolyticus]
MIHTAWSTRQAQKQVVCVHDKAAKYVVNNVLTTGKTYNVQNETEEFIFIIDNTGKVGGFYKDYFREI